MTDEQLIAAHHRLSRRVAAVLLVISNVARKTRREYLPASFAGPATVAKPEPARYFTRTTTGVAVVQLRYQGYPHLEFPQTLLAASDREVATWARSQIRRCRSNAYSRARTELRKKVEAQEKAVERAQATLDLHRRQLANLGERPKR